MEEAPIRLNHFPVLSYPNEIDSPDNTLLSSTKREEIGVTSLSAIDLNFALSPGCFYFIIKCLHKNLST